RANAFRVARDTASHFALTRPYGSGSCLGRYFRFQRGKRLAGGRALAGPPGAEQKHRAEGSVPGLDVIRRDAPVRQFATAVGNHFGEPRANVGIAAISAREITLGLADSAVIGIRPQVFLSGCRRRARSEIEIPSHSGHSTAGCETRSYSLLTIGPFRL